MDAGSGEVGSMCSEDSLVKAWGKVMVMKQAEYQVISKQIQGTGRAKSKKRQHCQKPGKQNRETEAR